MKTGYWFKSSKDGYELTNLPADCRKCFGTCKSASELYQCLTFSQKRRRGIQTIGSGEMYICTNEAIESKRIYREQQAALRELLPVIDKHRSQLTASFQESIRRIAHNLVTLNAESIQAVYSAIPQEEFSQADRTALIDRITRRVQADPRTIALLVLDIIKNERLVKTEFSVYSKLYENEPTDRRRYSIHKILMLVLNTFWDDFNEIGVTFSVGNCLELVNVDYECVAASLVHILQNATKYILPNSPLRINFTPIGSRVKVSFSMVSIKIESTEERSVFDEGYSGINPVKLGRAGRGLGLFVVQKLLALTDATIRLRRDVDPGMRRIYQGLPYEKNVFELDLPTAGG